MAENDDTEETQETHFKEIMLTILLVGLVFWWLCRRKSKATATLNRTMSTFGAGGLGMIVGGPPVALAFGSVATAF